MWRTPVQHRRKFIRCPISRRRQKTTLSISGGLKVGLPTGDRSASKSGLKTRSATCSVSSWRGDLSLLLLPHRLHCPRHEAVDLREIGENKTDAGEHEARTSEDET